jgi:CRP-like cAMP-binding protein
VAVASVPRIEERVLLALWHFAERWGRVTADGVRLDLNLTHAVLAEVVAAQRPSVSTALGRLQERGLLSRPGSSSWLLHGEPPANVRSLAEPREQAASA